MRSQNSKKRWSGYKQLLNLIIEFDENWADKDDRLELRSIYISKISIPNASE